MKIKRHHYQNSGNGAVKLHHYQNSACFSPSNARMAIELSSHSVRHSFLRDEPASSKRDLFAGVKERPV